MFVASQSKLSSGDLLGNSPFGELPLGKLNFKEVCSK